MNIIHFAYSTDGGAGRAARRASIACETAGASSSFSFISGKPKCSTDVVFELAKMVGERKGISPGTLFEKRVQWEFIPAHRTDHSNTLFSIPYPGIDVSRARVLDSADIIHLHWPTWAITPRAISDWLKFGKTIFWSLHDTSAFTGGCHYPAGCEQFLTVCLKCPQLTSDPGLVSNAFAERLTAYGNGGALWIISPSNWMAENARNSRIVGARPIHVVRNSIETELFAPRTDRDALRKEFGIAKKDLVLFFGSFDLEERRKGVSCLIEALRRLGATGQLVDLLPSNARVHLSLIGRSVEIEEIPGVWPLSIGQIDDDNVMADVLTIADLACIPSLEDNYPNFILEAMACGTPCLGFMTGGIGEMIIDGVTGILAKDVGSPDSLIDGILRFVRRHFQTDEMREACRARVLDTNNMLGIGTQLIELYEQALGRKVNRDSQRVRDRMLKAFAKSVVRSDPTPTEEFLRFPVNYLTSSGINNRENLNELVVQTSAFDSQDKNVIAVRAFHEHHSGRSGPYQFLRYLPLEYKVRHMAIPMGGKLAGKYAELYRKAGLLLGTRAFAEQGNAWLAEFELLAHCSSRVVDIVHYIDGELSGALLPSAPVEVFARGKRPLVIATFHQPESILRGLINIQLLNKFDALIALCESQRRFLANLVHKDIVFLVPHGVDTQFFRPRIIPPDNLSATRELRLLLVGHWLRDMANAFEAIRILVREGLKFRLDIISPGLPVASDGLPIFFHKGITDESLRQAYWDADILFLPLTDATANNAILEAMACGRAVVSTDVGGVRECVGEAAGILCPPADPQSLANAVLMLANDVASREAMGRAARHRAETFDWRTIAKLQTKVYEAAYARVEQRKIA